MIDNYPPISVIIPTFNRVTLIENTLKSIFSANYPENKLEVIVINDHSTDKSHDLLKNNKKIKYIYHTKNRGRSVTRNSGIHIASGEYIFFLDDDQIIDNYYFKAHLKIYMTNPYVVATVGHVRTPDKFKDIWGSYLESRGAVKIGENIDLPAKYFQIGNASIKSDILRKIGIFDKNITSYGGEDVEMGIRIKQYGKIYFSKAGISYHFDIPSLQQQLDRLEFFGQEGLKKIVARHKELKNEYNIKFFYFPYKLFWSSILYRICSIVFKYLPKLIAFKCISYMQGYRVFKGYSKRIISL